MSGMRRALTLLFALALFCQCGAAGVRAQTIGFRAAASAVQTPVTPSYVDDTSATMVGIPVTYKSAAQASSSVANAALNIAMPAGTVADDVMIATVMITPAGTAINGPAGWTRYVDQSETRGTGARLAVFWKKAAAGEAGPYTFTPAGGSTGIVGGIMTFTGVDANFNPIISSAAMIVNTTGSAGSTATLPSRPAGGITNTMLVGSNGYASSNTWNTPSGGMTEVVDAASLAPTNAAGVSLGASYQAWPTNTATGNRTAAAGNNTTPDWWIGHTTLLRPVGRLTIAAPAIAAGDVMIASIALRGGSQALTAPAGWTLVRRTDGNTDAHATATSVFTYWKTADATDVGASYDFDALGAVNGVGGIAAYRNADVSTPIDVDNGVAATSSGANETMTGPAVSTTVPNTQLVTAFAISNGRAWSNPSGGLTERVDVAQPSGNNTGVSLSMHDVARAATGNTGTFTANSSNQNDTGAAQLLALRPNCGVTISRPSAPLSLATGDVMIASIAVRDMSAALIVQPPGWTAVAGSPVNNSTAGNTMTLYVYYRVIANLATEPATYRWAFGTCEFVAGGIQAFRGVDAAAPVNVAAGSATANSLTHAAPGVTPTVPNTMLAMTFAIRSGATWDKAAGSPAAMTESFDAASPSAGIQVGLSIGGYYEPGPVASGSPTGTRSAVASNDSDTGATFMIALRPAIVVVAPARFNAYDPPVSGVSGVIRTKVSASPYSIAIVAVNTAGTAIETTFSNNVRVELVDASAGGGLDANNCNSGWPVIATPSASFALASGSATLSNVTVANSYRNVRVRIIHPDNATYATATTKGCSTDGFAIRPVSFTVAVSDATWSTAGTARALTNTGASGGTVHKAGQPFTITVTPSPGTVTLYDGSPMVSALACTLPGTCANGSLSPSTPTYTGAGVRTGTATYSEAGAFNLTLVDQDYAIVDQSDGTPADCSANGRYVCQSAAPLAVGRFVPDRFVLTAVTQPAFRTFDAADAACSVPPAGPRRSFTYIGQPFGYQTRPAALITAQNATGGTTTNYRGTLWKLTNASATQQFANSPSATLGLGQIGTPVITELADTGTGTFTANLNDKLSFTRDNTVPQAAFTANLSLTLSVSDATEAGANQGTIDTQAPLVFNGGGTGITFDSGAQFRYGRLQLGSARGSPLVALAVPMETQFWTGTQFATNAADHCTTLTEANFGLGNYAGSLNAGETNRAPLAGAFTAGRQVLTLTAPGATNPGSVDVAVNLGAAAMDACTVFAAPVPAPTAASQDWLRGRWCGATHSKDTTGRATFGVYLGSEEVIFLRENF